MRLLFAVTILSIALLNAGFVYAHGPAEETPMGSQTMLRMMELMHGNIDKNRTVNCAGLSDAELIKRGEEMMEQMMGKETHEKIEEEMEKISLKAHDDMHTMMGMWATGCVGDEAVNTMMGRYGISERLTELERKTQNQVGWPMVVLGVVLGAVGGWAGNQLLRKRQ